MLKLMLVDDEAIIRKGIRTSIDWSSYGVEIAGEAANGRDALELALELKPHIVITDIRMPVMDGLALSNDLKKQLPDAKIIVLSGYDDFAYAREALSLGVYEYLLKPVGAEDLISLITKLQGEILKEQAEKNESLSANIVFNENYPNIKSNFVNRILKGELPDSNAVMEKAKALKLDLLAPEYLVFTVDIDDFLLLTEDMPPRDVELLRFSVMNISEELLLSMTSGLVCYSEFEHLVGLVCAKILPESLIDSLCKEIRHCIKKYLGLSVSIGIGKSCKNILEVSRSYSEALTALRSKIHRGKGSIIHYRERDDAERPLAVLYPSNEEKEIINHLKTLNIDGLNTAIGRVFAGFASSNADPESIKNICSRLLVMAISSIEDMGIDIQEHLGVNFNPYRSADKFDVLEDLQQWLKALFEKMSGLIQERKNSKFKGIIKTALQYIKENYQRDLSLADIAGIVYVTPNYLSRVFKEEMGVNFVDWLNQFRVEKAKVLLLEAGMKSYEVAEKVGYSDYKYFSYIFKKYTGCTPKEYVEMQSPRL